MEELELVAGGDDSDPFNTGPGDSGDFGGGGDYTDGSWDYGDSGGSDSSQAGGYSSYQRETHIDNEFNAELQNDQSAKNVTVVIDHNDGTSTRFDAVQFNDGTFFADTDHNGRMDEKLIVRDGAWYQDVGDGQGYVRAPNT